MAKAKKNQERKKYEPHTMSEKFAYHSKRAFENHKPKDSHMTEAELAAFSAGYVKHARDTAKAYKYNLALTMNMSRADARMVANDRRIHFNDLTGQFERRA